VLAAILSGLSSYPLIADTPTRANPTIAQPLQPAQPPQPQPVFQQPPQARPPQPAAAKALSPRYVEPAPPVDDFGGVDDYYTGDPEETVTQMLDMLGGDGGGGGGGGGGGELELSENWGEGTVLPDDGGWAEVLSTFTPQGEYGVPPPANDGFYSSEAIVDVVAQPSNDYDITGMSEDDLLNSAFGDSGYFPTLTSLSLCCCRPVHGCLSL